MVPPDPHIPPEEPFDEELAERGRLLIAAAVAETRAPLALRERIEADRARVPRGTRSRPGWRIFAPVAGVVAAVAIALVVLVGGPGNPSVLATAALATKGPVLPAPAEDQSNDSILKASVGGVPFPYWGDSFQWEAVGARKDGIDGRNAKTVFYENPKGAQAAYTILDGKKLDPPKGARVITQRGTKLWVTEHDGRRIVVWTRGGHTCVLSAPKTIPESKMVDAASWNAKGKVPF